MEIRRNISFPTKPDELKVKHVVKYLSLPEKKRQSDLEVLMIFAGDLAKFVPIDDAEKMAGQIRELLNAPVDFHQTFIHNEIKYGFIPSLDDLTLAEYMDIKVLEQDGQMWANGHRILTILFRPVVDSNGEEYRIESYQGIDERRAQVWNEELAGEVLLGAMAFFFGLRINLSINSLASTKSTRRTRGR